MRQPILLDTCAFIWLATAEPLSTRAQAALDEAQAVGVEVLVSPITSWEIGMLVARNRLALTMAPLAWFEAILSHGIRMAAMPPSVLIASSQLPSPPLRDPADRIIAATAREFSYRLMTRDRPLLEFANAGHMAAIAC